MSFRLSARLMGFIYVLLSAAFYATMPILGKLMYQSGLTPGIALLLRYSFAVLVLVFYLGVIKREQILSRSPLVMVQGLFFVIGSLVYFYAVQLIPAGLITTIFFTYPAIVAIMAMIVYKEKINQRQILALILALGGIVIISGLLGEASHRLSPFGIGLVVFSSICYSCYVIIGQKTTDQTEPLSMVATHTMVALIVLAIIYPHDVIAVSHITLHQALLGLTMALVNTVLAIFFFLKGLAIIGASKAALVGTVEPAFTLLFAFILLGEVITIVQALGIILILASTTLALPKKSLR